MKRVVVVAAALAATQCVLLVDQSPSGDQFSTQCAVADPTSACGHCLTAQCSDEIASCCGDEACRFALSAIDTCSDAGTCLFDMSGAAGAVGQCIQTKCNGVCDAVDAGQSEGGGNVECFVSDHFCSCDNSFGTNGTTCDVATHTNSVCCADLEWPTGTDTLCECDQIGCSDDGVACDCQPQSSVGDTTSCNTSAWGVCCLSQNYCSCGIDCNSAQTPVEDCTKASLYQCASGRRVVPSCSN